MIVTGTVATFFRRYARGSRWFARFHADISAWIVTREEGAASRRNAFHLYTPTGSGFMAISACASLSYSYSYFSIRYFHSACYLWLWARLLTLDARLLPRGVFGIPSHSSASYSSPRKLLCCLLTVVKFIVLPSGGTFINANCCWAFLIDSIQDCEKLDVYIHEYIYGKEFLSISFTDKVYVYLGQFRFSGAENQSSWCRPILVQINQA